ncbi:MAG: hypothetical protein H7256_05975 [Bdellovibrio sp.]|nr:hypothetical protein [Bdellovibrio sp.]
MKFKSDSSTAADQMWQMSCLQSEISFACAVVLTLFFKNKVSGIAASFLMMAVVNGTSLFFLFHNRINKKIEVSCFVYIANVVAVGFGVLINHHFWLKMGTPFEAFFGFKIVAIIIALQAPVVTWVGWSSLIFLFVAPLTQYFIWSPEQQGLLGIQEPGFTAVVILSCGFIYFQRLKILEMVKKQAQLKASEVEIRRFAHLLLGAQHLINSPLQVIESGIDLIRIKHPDTEPIVKKIEASFEPIRHVSRLLSFGRQHLNWDEVNLALTVEDLEKEIQKISSSVEQARPPQL